MSCSDKVLRFVCTIKLHYLSWPCITGVSLSGVSLSGVSLSGVSLSGVSLSGVCLSGVSLSGVSLSGVWGMQNFAEEKGFYAKYSPVQFYVNNNYTGKT